MRPLRLVMRGFGAYAGEQALDFTLLGGDALFLIHGPTGAGKTTVLDAICFALYGETSGGERDGRQMRSDHAAPEAPTEVVFEFALGERTYRVERSPDYDRPARRGGGTTTQRATACLWRLNGAGPGEMLAAKPQAVNEKVRDLLGFKADQFRQVVVLPQGRFRQLLRADSQEREALMAVLFGTGALADLQERLKARAAELRREAEDWQRDRATLLGRADVEDEAALAARRAGVAAELGAVAGRLDGLRAAEQTARSALDAARAVEAKLAEAADAEATVRALAAEAAAFGARERELALARRAAELEGGRAGVEQADRRARDAADEADRAERRRDGAALALDGAVIRLAAEEGRGAERETARDDVARLTALAERLPALFAARERHAAAEAAQRRAAAGRDGLEREMGTLAEAAEATAADLGAAREAAARLDGLRLRAEELARARDDRVKLETGRRDLAAAQAAHAHAETQEAAARRRRDELRGRLADLERAWRAGQAGLLAESLAEGVPCPVCGATHHPAPATRPAGAPGEAELDGARSEVSEAEAGCEELARAAAERGREVARLRSRVEAIEAGLGAERAGSGPRELAALAERAREEAGRAARTAAGLDELEHRSREREARRAELGRALDGVRRGLDDLLRAEAAARAELSAAVADLPAELREAPDGPSARRRLESRLRAAEARRRTLDEALEQARTAKVEAEKALSAAAATLEAARDNAARAGREMRATVERFAAQVTLAGFADMAAFEAARRGRAEIDALEAEVERGRETRRGARDRLERARRAAEGLTPPDLAALERGVAEAEAEVEAAVRREAELRELAGRLESLAGDLARVNGELERVRGRYAVLGRVAEVANGVGNPYRITFQRFVLGALLDEVLDAASQRLRLMSQHRYALRRAAPGGDRRRHAGLELEVDDAYTGRARAVETLSGGEGFLASLALALGLADVVQARSGGLRLETVFVDEGFGALDPEALDLALRALIDLRRGGRLVGVISHVPELRERIDMRLEVSKGERGSTARFVLP